MKERQARTDLTMLTNAGFLQRLGAGPATTYIRTSKAVTGIPERFVKYVEVGEEMIVIDLR